MILYTFFICMFDFLDANMVIINFDISSFFFK